MSIRQELPMRWYWEAVFQRWLSLYFRHRKARPAQCLSFNRKFRRRRLVPLCSYSATLNAMMRPECRGAYAWEYGLTNRFEHREQQQHEIETLHDNYVRQILAEHGLKAGDSSLALVEAKRAHLVVKRELKERSQ